jgi:PAS domain S-box-containing protein
MKETTPKTVQKSPLVNQMNNSTLKSEDEQLLEKLIISEIRYRRLFESAKDGILILDFESGTIVDANPYIIKIIDCPRDRIIGKRLWEIGLFSNKEESENAFTELQTNGYIRFEDMPIQQRNGKVKEVEFISNVYSENNSKVIQCNIRDITERVKIEAALKLSEQNLKAQNIEYASLNKEYSRLNEELIQSIHRIQKVNNDLTIAKEKAEESDKLKSAFLANMSHEIRTPMNAINGFSELLLESGLPKDELAKYVHIINASSQQLLSVISDIVDISKIEAGQFSFKSEAVDINLLMGELLATYKKSIDAEKINLVYSGEKPDELVLLKSDGNRIKQVICNLLNNAVKFTSKGEIHFGYYLKDNFIEFFVSDNGIGISPKNQSVIFERFKQIASGTDKLSAGNGLGLSISKAIVEKLNGSISVQSDLGKGSLFSFKIPFEN